jgi:EF-P beta-lysylation protein EpmB
MIQRTRPSWQQCLQTIITDPAELFDILELDQQYLPAAIQASQLFPLKAPRPFVERMKKGDINDPLLRQILPLDEEQATIMGYSSDPVGEQTGQTSGIIHKYHGRVLLMVNGHCAINCRYCFRRHFPYEDNRQSRTQWEKTLEAISNDSSISEIIYSGGDPLASSDSQLTWLTEQISAIPHIKRLRIHTRLPVVIPQRITDECLAWMSQHRLKTSLVLHINHSNELKDQLLLENIQRIRHANISLFNQAVLLKGINDNSDTLIQLSEDLYEADILPYYLHVLDKVQGAAHFDISYAEAKSLHTELIHRLPGYLVPKLAQEEAGKPSKTLL